MVLVISVVQLVGGVLAALLVGLYLAFGLAVMHEHARLPDRVLVTTMQTINRVVVRPAFALLFVGAPVLAVAAAVLALLAGAPVLLVALGAVLQLVSIGVTVGVNIPLNTALDGAD